jgi:acid phosphatase (class A)
MIFNKKHLVLALALSLGACSGGNNLASPLSRALHKLQKPAYVSPEVFKTAQFAPPPAAGSEEQKADIASVLNLQRERTEADCLRARGTANANYDFFWGESNPFPAPLPAAVKKFFRRLDYDCGESVTVMKNRFLRPRPFIAYQDAQPCCSTRYLGYSYPSGHAFYARVFANVLGDIVPERKDEFMSIADAIAADRVIGGVHYPTDIAAGKVFGDEFHARLLKSHAYLHDIEKMKSLLRK